MTKTKTQAAAAQNNTAAPAVQVSFLQNLSKLAEPMKKPQAVKADPLATMRNKFVANADDQIKLIQAAAPKGKWFEKKDGKYVICFRNANQAMTLNEETHFGVPSAEAAVTFIQAAVQGAKAGELDAALLATQRKKKDAETAK